MAEQSEMLPLVRQGVDALGVDLTAYQLSLLARFGHLLVAASRSVNLTSVTDWDRIQVVHFVDSLTLVPILNRRVNDHNTANNRNLTILDVGSGAGLPGIPLAIAFPDAEVTLLEATGKKAAFISSAIDRLEMLNAHVLSERAESLGREPAYRERFSVGVVRAVGSVAVDAELAAPFVAEGGLILIMKKRSDADREFSAAGDLVRSVGCELARIEDVSIPGLLEDRAIVVLRKDGSTPAVYPRRPGVAQRKSRH